MKDMQEKYANLLINRCLSIKEKQPLFISAPIESIDFVRILSKIAIENGVRDIHYEFSDEILKHNELMYYDNEDLFNSSFFNKSAYDEYAKKNAAFLMLCYDESLVMSDVDKDKMKYIGKINISTRPFYKEKQLKYEVPWCIASVATDTWAKRVFPNEKNSKEKLWNEIFKMCLIDKDDPILEWNKKLKKNKELVDKLNSLEIESLHYKNKLGTDFIVGFENNIWCGADAENNLIVNMPTEEVFTSPSKYTANGVVYASKPLIYSNSLIENFWIEFKNGKVINSNALVGDELLKSIFKIKGGDYLGEVALVSSDSPISKSNILFYETLFDENASCHLALGQGFLECTNYETLENSNINNAKTHVDFMIGTDDLEIVATCKDGHVTILKDGKFVI